jgi:hypothetical protein
LFLLFHAIFLQEPPLEIVSGLKNIKCKEEQSFKLEVELNKADNKVKWLKNGEQIDEDDKNIVIERGTGFIYRLIVLKADLDHAGKYAFKTSEPYSSCYVEIEGR